MSSLSSSANPHTLLNPQEVAANRNGRITDAQRQRARVAVAWNQGCGAVILLPFLLIFGAISLAMWQGRQESLLSLLFSLGFGIAALVLLGMLGWSLGQVLHALQKVNQDLQQNAIRQAQGRVAFSKQGYVFDADGRHLRLPRFDQTAGLLPGVLYRVYYLAESGVVLSAEEAFLPSPAQVRTALNEILAQANRFSQDDLTANRNGILTAHQKRQAIGQAILGITLFVMTLVAAWFGQRQIFPLAGDSEAFLSLLVLGVILLLLLFIGGQMTVRNLLDLALGTIEQVEGTGRKEKRVSGGRSRTTQYFYVIGNHQFQVNARAYNALFEGVVYRAYFLPRTRKLLSIEAVDVTDESGNFLLRLS